MAVDEKEAGNLVMIVIVILVLLGIFTIALKGKGGEILAAFLDKLRFGR